MKSMSAKITIAVYVIAASTFIFSSYAFKAYKSLEKHQDNIHLSLYLRGFAKEIENKPLDKENIAYFKTVRKNVQEDYRVAALSNIIQALNAKSPTLKAMRFKEFQESERRYYNETLPEIEASKDIFKKYVFLAILSPLIGIFLFSVYLKRSIVVPLQKLSQRMMDFLIDRYTFKFSTPDNNELGDLQRTFNSLAQRAINSMDELKALDRAKSEFVSIASHELRTPLTSIKGSLGLLSSGIVGELNDEAQGLIRIAEHETDRLVRLINNLLDLAKMESRTFKLQKEWGSVQELAESCADSLLGLAQTAGVHLQIERPQQNIEVQLDRDRIQQVITNLMSNAIKYSPKGSAVTIRYFINAQNVLEIDIIDCGPGIAPADQELIFEKFRQATQPESKLVKGTGLGLAISKALVEEHGGIISVRSEPGRGSSFYFTLPEWREIEATISQKDAA
jgi:signal transduction histidine kinase